MYACPSIRATAIVNPIVTLLLVTEPLGVSIEGSWSVIINNIYINPLPTAEGDSD